jgi:hypothetical protein
MGAALQAHDAAHALTVTTDDLNTSPHRTKPMTDNITPEAVDNDFSPATMDNDTIYIGTRKYVAVDTIRALFARVADLEAAASALIADVRARYPNEDLRCPHMIALASALADLEAKP